MAATKTSRLIDELGHQYGHLEVIGRSENRDHKGRVLWVCRCICKNEIEVFGHSLRSGNTKSCGCQRSINAGAAVRTHGMYDNYYSTRAPRSPELNSWNGMRRRCYVLTNPKYKDYGGRGITVCDRWLGPEGFANFLADMGLKPSNKHSIDRTNNDGNYEPSNCRWATAKEQVDNRRVKKIENFSNDELLREIVKRNIPKETLWHKLTMVPLLVIAFFF